MSKQTGFSLGGDTVFLPIHGPDCCSMADCSWMAVIADGARSVPHNETISQKMVNFSLQPRFFFLT